MSNWAFLQPWFFVAFPIAVFGLYLIYRQGEKAKRLIVSSLFLFEQLQQKVSNRRKFLPPLRFLLELLAILCLVLAGMLVVSANNSRHVVIVIDNSLSMAHQSQVGNPASARIEKAKSLVWDILDSTASNNRFSLVVSAPDPHFFVEEVGLNEIESHVDSIKPVDASGDLSLALQFALQVGPDALHVISDHFDRRLEMFSETSLDIELHSVERFDSYYTNLAIEKVDQVRQGNQSELLVVVRNFSDTSQRRKILFEVSDSFQVPMTWRAVTEIERDFPADQSSSLSLKVEDRAWQFGRVVIQATDSKSSDSLENDNFWYLTNRSTDTRPQIAVISPLDISELGLDDLDGYQFVKFDQQSFRQPERLTEIFGYILHQVEIDSLPSKPALVIAPQSGKFVEQSSYAPIEIVEIESNSPALKYVETHLLNFPNSSILAPPLGARNSIVSSEGPILALYENDAVRFGLSGFELLPYGGARNRMASIILLNLLQWTFSDIATISSTPPHRALVIKKEIEEFSLHDATSLPLDFRGLHKVVTPHSRGIMIGRDARGEPVYSLAVNAFHSSESDPGFRHDLSHAQPSAGALEKGDSYSPLFWVLSFLGLVLLLLDLILFDALKFTRRTNGSV